MSNPALKFLFLAPLCLSACSEGNVEAPTALNLTPLWVSEGFESPESVLLGRDETFLYVSNVNGEGADKDGNGYISKIGMDGVLLEKSWAVGLNGPKGMAMWDQYLYVSDIDQLVKIDLTDGAIIETFPIAGAGFLNDVLHVPGLGVLASDSATQSIFHFDGTEVSKWLEDESFSGINGLLLEDNALLVTTMDEGHLLSVNLNDKTIDQLASGMSNADGISALSGGNYLVSSWPGQLHHVSGGDVTTLLDTQTEPVYMNDFILHDGTLYVPNWQPGTVRAYSVK